MQCQLKVGRFTVLFIAVILSYSPHRCCSLVRWPVVTAVVTAIIAAVVTATRVVIIAATRVVVVAAVVISTAVVAIAVISSTVTIVISGTERLTRALLADARIYLRNAALS